MNARAGRPRHRGLAARLGRFAFAVAVAGAAAAVSQEGAGEATLLGAVEIHCADVFDAAGAATNPVYGLANALHAITDEAVVAREVWLAPGDRITAADAAEIERNLRALGLFGAVTVELRPAGPGRSDLVIRTRDRFSLTASAGVSRVGGIDKVVFRLSESNLLGTGKAVALASSRADGQRAQLLHFTDPQLFGSWHVLDVDAGTTDTGGFASVALSRPQRRLEDPFTYGCSFAHVDENLHRYRDGRTVAEVPSLRDGLHLFGARSDGRRELRRAIGLDLRASRRDYDPAFGEEAALVRVPGATQEFELGPYWSLDWRPRFDVVRRLDALDYDEDIALGMHCDVRLAGRWRDEAGVGDAVQPLLATAARAVFAPVDDCYVALATAATARLEGDREVGWHVGASAHACWLGLPAQTLVFRATIDDLGERQDFAAQLTLGEDNGLRGYSARAFAGSRRVRLNVEDRIDTGIEILSVHIGLAAFCDVGWMDDPDAGRALGAPHGGVGVGLRFGSSHLVGRQVLRLDCAWPLDADPVAGNRVSVSFTVGQLFGFLDDAIDLGR
ncbi:MAG: hypothetical protein U1E73_10080 [Planctomycetota bacterium]